MKKYVWTKSFPDRSKCRMSIKISAFERRDLNASNDVCAGYVRAPQKNLRAVEFCDTRLSRKPPISWVGGIFPSRSIFCTKSGQTVGPFSLHVGQSMCHTTPKVGAFERRYLDASNDVCTDSVRAPQKKSTGC